MFVPCQTRISAWVPSLSTHVWVTSYACSTVAQQTFMRQHGPRVTHYERPAAFLSTLIYWQWILSQYLPCLHSFQARPEADQLLNRSIFCWRQILLFYVRKPKINLCMSSKLKYTYLKRYACSKLAQKRFMRQGGPRVTYYERPAAFLSTFSHWHSQKKQMNLVQVCHASTLSRLGWIIQDFVEYFRTVSHEC